MLTVYRASAGSGKTHKLTGEYLKLLFRHPAAYRQILAVTFTNKATDEMKGRIVEELHKLASGQPSDYAQLLASNYRLTEDSARQKAKEALVAILHDYSAFHISTIDRFFHQTLRAFTRETGLQGGYDIEMDHKLVLSEAVDQLLADLEKPEQKELLEWLLRFAEDKMESGGGWNLRRDILALSEELFKERYKVFSDQVSKDIADKQSLEQYKSTLYALIRTTEQQAQALGEQGLSLLDRYELLPTDFKGAAHSPLLYFQRLAKGEMKEPSVTFVGLIDNLESCYTKTASPDIVQKITTAFNNGLNDCIKEVAYFFHHLANYYTAKEITRHYYTLGILNDVARQIAVYRQEKNVLLMADTTELLNKIIDNSDTPFIYEKTGTHIAHYMIDEFQDTSAMQWHNFRPLINESLAQQHSNLIVGDIKQSIYRFRNSDWELLDSRVKKDFRKEQLNEETLKDNWRSSKCIVEFNNELFAKAPTLLQETYNEALADSALSQEEQQRFSHAILSAYQHSEQSVPPIFQNREGHVAVDFLPNDNEASWQEQARERLLTELQRLQHHGFEPKDIAILVRTNREAADIANLLLAHHLPVLSDDALFLTRSPAVRFIIALLKHLKNPNDPANLQRATFAFAVLTNNWHETNNHNLQKALRNLSHLSLYELTEELLRRFADFLPSNEQVFIQALLDNIVEFAQKGNPDLNRFLLWWDDTGAKQTLPTPDEQNAIRILTIHKAKGLGFPAVILPLCNWDIDHKPQQPVTIWCKPSTTPFNYLHLVPIRYSAAIAKTRFAFDYFQERLRTCIDNLNLLYVASTRAKDELLIFAPQPSKTHKISSIAHLLWQTLGQPINKGTTSQRPPATNNPAHELPLQTISSVSPNKRLHLRLLQKDCFSDNNAKKHGNIMHEILSHIITTNDIPNAVDNAYQQGKINQQQATTIKQQLHSLLSQPNVAPLFDPSARILNETDILANNKPPQRPDRIIIRDQHVTLIDYKFGQPHPNHQQQLSRYLQQIQQMGYHTTAFLWYINPNTTHNLPPNTLLPLHP